MTSEPHSPVRSDASPDYSVIVPVFEQWHLAEKLLACLDRQTIAPERFEIILVDDEATDSLAPKIRHPKARIVRAESKGSYAARNRGAASAKGRRFAFTDADCLPEAGWLAAIDRAFDADRAEATILIGPVEMRPEGERVNLFEMYDIVKGIPQRRYVARGYGATANLALERALFESVGGFDPSRLSGGDAEFCRRAAEARGAGVAFVPGAVVAHPARRTWRAIATKARRVKGGQLRAGSPRQKAIWAARTLTPPLRAMAFFLRNGAHPIAYRLAACGVQIGIWGLEIGELARLAFGGSPERR